VVRRQAVHLIENLGGDARDAALARRILYYALNKWPDTVVDPLQAAFEKNRGTPPPGLVELLEFLERRFQVPTPDGTIRL
jgi:hypothetical protein